MSETENQRWDKLEFWIGQIHRDQKNLHQLNQQLQAKKGKATPTAVQRAAITEQFRYQADLMARWKNSVNDQLTDLKQLLGPAKLACLIRPYRRIIAEAEEIADEIAELKLSRYENIADLFTERTAVQQSVISKQLPVQTEERPGLELPEYEDIPDLSPEEMIEEYLKSRTEEEEEEDRENGITDNDMIDFYLESVTVSEEEDFKISAEGMKETARVESERRTEFFKRPGNKGKQGQIHAELNYLLNVETWDPELFLRSWIREVEYWTDHADWDHFTAADIKYVLWDLLTPERRKVVTVLQPGSKSFAHDPLDEYIRRLMATFQPALYTDRRKREYEARVHNQGESVDKYIADKMKLFKASHRTYDFKQFLQTGLQSIYPSTLQQHITAQPYRNEEGLMRNIAAISAKLKTLPDSKPNPTGTLAGITPPMQRGESRIQSTQTRAVSHPHSRTSECITEACPDSRGQEEKEYIRRREIQERLTRGQPTRDGGPPPHNPS